MTEIKRGYMIEIDSWENDADHRQTVRLDGLSVKEVMFYRDLLEKFRSRNDHDSEYKPTYGNTHGDIFGIDCSELQQYVLALCEKYENDYFEDDADDNEIFLDRLLQLVGDLLGNSEDYAFRVYESMRIYYIPSKIIEQKFKNIEGLYTSGYKDYI